MNHEHIDDDDLIQFKNSKMFGGNNITLTVPQFVSTVLGAAIGGMLIGAGMAWGL